jgi:hypothetical protein
MKMKQSIIAGVFTLSLILAFSLSNNVVAQKGIPSRMGNSNQLRAYSKNHPGRIANRREGKCDRRENVRDHREDIKDRKEDIRDRREDKRDAREDKLTRIIFLPITQALIQTLL